MKLLSKENNFVIFIHQLYLRLHIGLGIIFARKKNFFICSISQDNLVNMLKADLAGDGDYSKVEIEFTYHRLQPYNVYKMVEIIYDKSDAIDMALHKAEYEANAQSRKNP